MSLRKFFSISSETKRSWAELRSAIESGGIRACFKTVSKAIGAPCASGDHFMLHSGQFANLEIIFFLMQLALGQEFNVCVVVPSSR